MTLPHVVLVASTDRRLAPNDLRIYLLLYTELDSGEFRPVKQSWISRKVGISRQWVNPAIARLVDAGYLRQGRDAPGGICTYRITLSPKPPTNEQHRGERRATAQALLPRDVG